MGFPATCYYFGESLSDAIANASGGSAHPIGLVNTAWGGSSIEEWLSNDTIASCEFSPRSSLNQEFHDQRVLPYTGMTVKGWTWYQGENDMRNVMGNAASKAGYACMQDTHHASIVYLFVVVKELYLLLRRDQYLQDMHNTHYAAMEV